MNKFPTTRSQFNFFFPLQNNFASVQLSQYLFLSPHCHQNTLLADNAKSRCRASYMYRVTTYIITWQYTAHNTRTSTLTVTLLNKIWSIRGIATATTVVTKEAWLPFAFNCWQSSRPSLEHSMNTGSFDLVFRNVNIQMNVVTLITSYTNPSTLKLDAHSSLQYSYPFYTYTPDIPICHCVHEYLTSLNVLTYSFVFLWVRGPAHSENTQCDFSVWAYREQCIHL